MTPAGFVLPATLHRYCKCVLFKSLQFQMFSSTDEELNLIRESGDQENHGDDKEKPPAEKNEEMASRFVKRLLHGLVSAEELQKNEEPEEEEGEQGKGSGSSVAEEEAVKNGGDGEREEVSGIRNEASTNGGQEIKVHDNGGTVVGHIINNLVSHLPPSLPDDAAPTTDEATILIHSIIHD